MPDYDNFIFVQQAIKNFHPPAFFNADLDITSNNFVVLHDIDGRLFVFIKQGIGRDYECRKSCPMTCR